VLTEVQRTEKFKPLSRRALFGDRPDVEPRQDADEKGARHG
jgi:hypothetical protein